MSMRLATVLLIALAAMSAHAQNAVDKLSPDRSSVLTGQDTKVVPVWNNQSGKVEALLLLQPQQHADGAMLFGAGARINTGHGALQRWPFY